MQRCFEFTMGMLLLLLLLLICSRYRSWKVLSLKLSDSRAYEPQIRARIVTTAHFCEVVGTGRRGQDGKEEDAEKLSKSNSEICNPVNTISLRLCGGVDFLKPFDELSCKIKTDGTTGTRWQRGGNRVEL